MSQPIKVWDLPTRCFHWSLVACFFIAFLSGDDLELIHVYSSYAIIGLLAFRLLWGVIGPRYVRFSQFVVSFKTVLTYLRSLLSSKPIHYLGHNPAGGWMIIALLIFLSLTSWTGLELYALEGKGPLANVEIHLVEQAHANGRDKDDDDERHDRENERGEEWLEDLHEALANFTLFLVFIHIAGVLVSSLLHRENLIRSMWTGYKTPPE